MRWQPLPKIAHGIAVYPFTPSLPTSSTLAAQPSPQQQQQQQQQYLSTSRPTTAYSTIQSPLLSPDAASIYTSVSSSSSIPGSSSDSAGGASTNPADYACLIPLEVGDELFILEQQGQWYRGYVLSSLEEGNKANTAPIGCFPRTHVQIKEYIDLDPNETNATAALDHHRLSLLFAPDGIGPLSPAWATSPPPIPASPPQPPDLSRSLSESHIKTKDMTATRHPPPPHHQRHSQLLWDQQPRPKSMVDRVGEEGDDLVKPRKATPPSLMLARFDQSTITGSSEPLVDEIGACVSEWNCLLYKYLDERRYAAFNSVRDHINYLFQARRQLLDQALSKEELSRLRKEIIHRMVMLNLSQHREMIIRHPERGYILDANSTSLPMLLRMHWKYALAEHIPLTSSFQVVSRPSITPSAKTPSSMDPATNTATSPTSQQQQQQQPLPPAAPAQHTSSHKGAKFHHLFFEYKACVAHICQPGEFTELYFSLYSAAENRFLTEPFQVVLTFNGMPTDERQIGKLQTLFADLSAHDLNDHLYLVCRIIRLGNMKYSDKEKDTLGTIGSHASLFFGGGNNNNNNHHDSATPPPHRGNSNKYQPSATRRPFGCAVLHLGPLLEKEDQSPGGTAELLSPGGTNAMGAGGSVSSGTGSISGTSISGAGTTSGTGTGSNGSIAGINSGTGTVGGGVTSGTSAGTAGGGGFRHITQAEHDIPIYTAGSESTFATLHEDIIAHNTKDYVKNPRAETLCVSLRMFFGQLDDVLKTNAALLQDVPRTLRLGFPDVAFPDDTRNELYITLNAGDFVQFASRSKNIQVTICARDNVSGEVIENALSAGAGAPFTTYWDSTVFYHEQRPRWGETLKLQMKDHRLWERVHLFFTVRHRSSHTGSGSSSEASNDKVISMGFLPLFLPPAHRYFVADGTHTLVMYKYDRQLTHPRVYLDNVAWCSRSSAPFNMQQQQAQDLVSSSSPLSGTSGGGSKHSTSIYSLKNANRTYSSTSIQHSTSSNSVTSESQHSFTDAVAAAAKLSPVKDTLTVTTFLCSTRYTQNETLVKLLNWRSVLVNESNDGGYDELLQILDKFSFVGEMEVVKFLNDIFDALLDILVYRHRDSKRGERVCDEALGAIIWVLGIVQDRRFSNFRPVLDVYVEQRFATDDNTSARLEHQHQRRMRQQQQHSGSLGSTSRDDLVYEHMLKGMLRLCTNPSEPRKAKRLRSSMKVWEYVFRFMVRSRAMQQQREEDGERGLRDIMFQEELQQLLDLIGAMMSPDQPSVMIGTQTLALQHFADILGELRRVFTPRQLVDITTGFVNGCAHVTGKLVGYRLCMILAIVRGPVFNDHTCRSGLAKSVFKWITVWLNSYMAAAKNVIFSRQHDSDAVVEHQQMRLPRVQWLEYLRLSLTIISEVLDKVRKLSGMTSLGLSSGSMSPSLSTLSRPISMATSGDEDTATLEESYQQQTELMTTTEIALQLVPQLLNAYKDLQRLTIQAIHASGMGVADTSSSHTSGGGPSQGGRTSSRHSLSVLRDRSSSMTLKHSPSMMSSSSGTGGSSGGGVGSHTGSTTTEGPGGFSVVLQALATSPTTPFPSTYPFQATSLKNNPSVVATGNLAAMVTTGLLDITVVLLELFHLTPQQQWVDFLCNMYENDGAEAMASFLRQVVHVCMAMLFGDSVQRLDESHAKDDSIHHEQDEAADTRKLPDSWLNLSVIAHKIVLCDILGPAVAVFDLPGLRTDHHHTEDTVIEDLWRTFLVGLLRVMSSPRLDIETFLPQTQRVVWKLADNMKGVVGAKSLMTLWRLAGPKVTATAASTRQVNGYSSNDTIEEEKFISADEGEEDEMENTTTTGHDIQVQTRQLNDEKQADDDDQLATSNQNNGTISATSPSSLQLSLVPVILRPLCGTSLTLHDKVRATAVNIMADIIAIELQTFGELSRVQNLLISTIDLLVMNENKGNDSIKVKLIPELYEALEKKLRARKVDDVFIDTGSKLVDSLYKFLDLLLKIRGLPLDNDEFVEDRISAMLKLMEFIQVIKREDIYIKYVHQLVGMHVDSNNHVEAALTLQLHANLIPWDPHEELEAIPDLNLPAQSAFARKERLYKEMLAYMEKGSAWELCIRLCKELAAEYESTLFDYTKLSEILQRQAQFAEDIAKKERYFAEYFRVAFYGRGFPSSVRHQQFIYRGLEWEKMASFVERMQNQHPNAQLLSGKYATATVLTDEQLRELDNEVDAQYLHITAVTPEPSNVDILENPLIPDNIKKYYASNDVWRFSYSRPFNKGATMQQEPPDASKPEIDFLNLWTMKTVFTCEESFPSTARRSKVVSVEDLEISPIENAVLAMENKNAELMALERKYAAYLTQRSKQSNVQVNISPFSMALNGAVDAPVNGGVSLYKKAFLTDWYWEKNPDMRSWVRRLKTAINEQVEIIEHCLEIHRRLVSHDMRPFHRTLVDFFKKNFKDEIEYLHKYKDSHRQQESEHPLDGGHAMGTSSSTTTIGSGNSLVSRSASITGVGSGTGGGTSPLSRESTQERPALTRQNSATSSIASTLPPSLPMSPVFSTMRSPPPPSDVRPASMMVDLPTPSELPEPAIPPSRAETLSRSLKMSLRKKKRPQT
ncbi:hypothetical protein LRAMOSA00066 [Lichtheimia ramosa]|uniref:Uncharacterized protein n=1 Tax=Lichtheimia ramosa TaxID=688394 RepID=A0A077W6I5_9FUNG|nr:hypothetical protein LRAMOSA00066 [Lichtheimia ramosa]